MKKIIIILSVLFLGVKVNAQFYPTPYQTLGGTSVNIGTQTLGGLFARTTFVPPVYADTSAASANLYCKNYGGGIIFAYASNSYWFRSFDLTHWIEFAGGSGSINIYNSDGTIPTNREVTVSTNTGLFFRNATDSILSIQSDFFGSPSLTIGDDRAIDSILFIWNPAARFYKWGNNTDYFNLRPDSNILEISADSLRFVKPLLLGNTTNEILTRSPTGNLYYLPFDSIQSSIPTLQQVTDANPNTTDSINHIYTDGTRLVTIDDYNGGGPHIGEIVLRRTFSTNISSLDYSGLTFDAGDGSGTSKLLPAYANGSFNSSTLPDNAGVSISPILATSINGIYFANDSGNITIPLGSSQNLQQTLDIGHIANDSLVITSPGTGNNLIELIPRDVVSTSYLGAIRFKADGVAGYGEINNHKWIINDGTFSKTFDLSGSPSFTRNSTYTAPNADGIMALEAADSINTPENVICQSSVDGLFHKAPYPTSGTLLNGTGYVKQSGLTTSYIPSIPNSDLAHSSITLTSPFGLTYSGSGVVALGNTITITPDTTSTGFLLRKDSIPGGYYPYSSNPKGYGTILSVTAGTDLTGGGSFGNIALNADTTTGATKLATQNFVGRQGYITGISTHTNGYGISGSSFNGTTPQTWTVDTTGTGLLPRRDSSIAGGYYPFSTNPKNYLTSSGALSPTFGTQGSVLFRGAASISQDNSHLFYDSTNQIFYVGTNFGAFTNTIAMFKDSVNSFGQVGIINKSAGTLASSDLIVNANDATDSTNYLHAGINSSGYTGGNGWGSAHDSYLYAQGGNLNLGTGKQNDIYFLTGGFGANSSRRMEIDSVGNVAIGTIPQANSLLTLKQPVASDSTFRITNPNNLPIIEMGNTFSANVGAIWVGQTTGATTNNATLVAFTGTTDINASTTAGVINFQINGGSAIVSTSSTLFQSLIASNLSTTLVVGSTASISASSTMDINGTKGVLLPRLTTAQMVAITSPAQELMVSNTSIAKLEHYNTTSSSWIPYLDSASLSPGAGISFIRSAGGAFTINATNTPLIVASAELANQSAAGNILTYTTGAADSTFTVSAHLEITALTAGTLQTQVTYTPASTNTPVTVVLFPMGLTSAGLTSTGTANYAVMGELRVKASTTITVATNATVALVGVNFFAGTTITKIR